MTTISTLAHGNGILDTVLQDDCVTVMRRMRSETIDFVLTDPPYVNRYTSRDGRSIRSGNFVWLKPAFVQLYRELNNAGM